MDIQKAIMDAIELAGDELMVIESAEKERAEAYANGRYDLFDETTENMIHNYGDFTKRIHQILEAGNDPGPSEPQTIVGYEGHRAIREQTPSPERPRHKTTINDIANQLAVMTHQGKANWEPNGPEYSFKLRMDDVQVILTKAPHTLHPTISVLNDKGQVVDSYTASDFLGTMGRTLADMHRMVSKQVYSTEQTLDDAMNSLLRQK